MPSYRTLFRRWAGVSSNIPGIRQYHCFLTMQFLVEDAVEACRQRVRLTHPYRSVFNLPMESQRQPDITRARILEAAFAEIHRHGFQAASIANILADTGLTKGALYHHFSNKQALGLAVVDEVIRDRLVRRYFEPLRAAAHPVEVILQILENVPERAHELVPLGCPLNNLVQEMSPIDPAFQTRLGAILQAWRDEVCSALRRAQAQGELRPEVDCEAAALFIVSAWEGCIGIAKNLQSVEALLSCGRQLQHYIRSLQSAPSAGGAGGTTQETAREP